MSKAASQPIISQRSAQQLAAWHGWQQLASKAKINGMKPALAWRRLAAAAIKAGALRRKYQQPLKISAGNMLSALSAEIFNKMWRKHQPG
jgi:hypothetical protein